MTRSSMAAAGIATLVMVAAVVWWLTHAMAAPDAAPDPADARTIALGAPQPSVQIAPAASYQAFPADILARTRSALSANASRPPSRPGVTPQTND